MARDELDDLRQSTLDSDYFDDFDEDLEDLEVEREVARERREQALFLGMTPAERMMISIFLFMNVSILMLAFLLATRRIVF